MFSIWSFHFQGFLYFGFHSFLSRKFSHWDLSLCSLTMHHYVWFHYLFYPLLLFFSSFVSIFSNSLHLHIFHLPSNRPVFYLCFLPSFLPSLFPSKSHLNPPPPQHMKPHGPLRAIPPLRCPMCVYGAIKAELEHYDGIQADVHLCCEHSWARCYTRTQGDRQPGRSSLALSTSMSDCERE